MEGCEKRAFRVGDEIEIVRCGRQPDGERGIIRHIGELNNIGDSDSLWSSWEEPFNGEIRSLSAMGGGLSYITKKNARLVKPSNEWKGDKR